MSGAGSVPRWPVIAGARIAITTVAAAGAVVASFVFLTGLAAGTGWPGWSASLLPLSVDALAAGAWLSYWTATDRDCRRFAGRIGVVATAASLAGNALSHLLVTGQVRPGWLLVAVVGSVPAVSLALVVKMAVPTGTAGSVSLQVEGGTEPRENSAPPNQPVPVPVEVSPPPPGAGAGPGRVRHTRTEPNRTTGEAELLNRFLASGRKSTVENVQDELGVSRRQALRLNREFQAVIGSSNGHGKERTS